eukprot:15985-Heterococcus_DN1.PRE.1
MGLLLLAPTLQAQSGTPNTWAGYTEANNFCYVYPSAIFDKYGKPALDGILCSKASPDLPSVAATAGLQTHQ